MSKVSEYEYKGTPLRHINSYDFMSTKIIIHTLSKPSRGMFGLCPHVAASNVFLEYVIVLHFKLLGHEKVQINITVTHHITRLLLLLDFNSFQGKLLVVLRVVQNNELLASCDKTLCLNNVNSNQPRKIIFWCKI